MTAAREEKVRAFLEISYGDGYGDGDGSGSGSGSGSGYGDGSGYGSGYGYGYGDGYGDGYGSGSGDGIIKYNGMTVYQIDDVYTLITAVHANLARGYILRSDLTLEPCRVAKVGDKFAHGETAEKALEAAREKLFDDMPEEERIAAFWAEHEPGVKYPARDFFAWHHRLTGSCEMGRQSFCWDHGIDLEAGMYTVEEFVAMTKNSYGGAVVARLLEGHDEASDGN